jgi:anti-anti-sigma factor
MSPTAERRSTEHHRRSLRYTHDFIDDATVVTLAGSIDVSTIDDLGRAISGCRLGLSIIVDMSGVDFCAAVGLRLLLATQTRLRRTRRTLTLRRPSRSVLRMLEILELTDAFIIETHSTPARTVDANRSRFHVHGGSSSPTASRDTPTSTISTEIISADGTSELR